LILAGVRQRVNEGGALADSLAQHPRVFPELYINMVRSGEAAGNLDAVLARLADFMDEQIALGAKVSSALTYPIVMAVLGSVVMGILMVVVVPQIASVFEDSGKALPWNTPVGVRGRAGGRYWWILVPCCCWGPGASAAGPGQRGGGRWSTGWR
jgi:general secretion pathway protein F